METVATVASTLAQYGPWGACAILAAAIVYLFRLIISLQKEMRDTIQTNLKDTVEVIASAKRVMEQTAESIREQKATTESLKEIVRLLMAKISG